MRDGSTVEKKATIKNYTNRVLELKSVSPTLWPMIEYM